MKKIIPLLLLLCAAANALSVDSLSVAPEIWLGDPVNITAVCISSDRAYTDISSPDVILPSLDMTNLGGGAYGISVPGNYFSKRGSYNARVSCTSGNETANASAGFAISEIRNEIASVTSPLYEQDIAEIVVLPKKNDALITTGVTFNIFLDGMPIAQEIPPIYETARGWVLRIKTPAAKTYSLSVAASHSGKTVSAARSMEVRPLVDFAILSADRYLLQKKENVTLTVRAIKRGTVISLDNLAVRVNGISADVLNTTQSGGSYIVRAAVPDISPGRYTLIMEITNNATLYSSSINITYVSLLTGKAEKMHMGFYKSGSLLLYLDSLSDGSYSAQIVPDIYDVKIEFEDTSIDLESANVNSLSDPISYVYKRGATVEGFRSSGIYEIGSAWSFSKATVKLRYTPSYFDDNDLKVFKCSLWNTATNKCNTDWADIIPSLGENNMATFSVSSFSAFIVGKRESPKVFMTFDKKKYAKKDLINVRGTVMAGTTPIANASISLKIENTYVDHLIYTNQNGVFNFDFLGPTEEGNYTMKVVSKKYPYTTYSGNYIVEVVNMPSFSIMFPSSVQAGYGNKTTEDIMIVNTGQSPITGLKIESDLDRKFYEIGDYSEALGVQQEIHVPITFYGSAEPTTMSATLKISSTEVSEEKTFGFTILEPPPASSTTITGFAIAMPEMSDTLIITAFATVAFSAAFVLKKIKTRPAKRNFIIPKINAVTPKEHTNTHSNNSEYLNDIKNYLGRREK